MELISGNGSESAALMVVADYVRKNDSHGHQCLSGYYYKRLQEYFLEQSLNINETYRTCIVKVYEKGLGVGTYGQDKKLLAGLCAEHGIGPDYFLNILLDEIKLIKPTVILALGEFVLESLTGKRGISKWRGSCLTALPELINKIGYDPKIVIANHPSIEHQDESQKYILRMDIKKAVDLLSDPYAKLDDYQIVIAKTTNDYLRFRSQYPDNPPELNTDIETHHGFITCASVSFDGKIGCTIPMVGSKVDLMEHCRMAHLLALDLNNPLIGKINQNMAYDKRIYQRFGFYINPIVWDTMLAAHTIAPEFNKNLGFLISINTKLNYHKDEGKEFDPAKHSYDQLYEYCAKDSIGTLQVKHSQEKDLEEMGMLDFFNGYVMKLFDMYYENDSVGLLLNTDKRNELLGKYEGMYNLKYMEVLAITDPVRLNLNSPSQIGKWMDLQELPVYRHRVDSGAMIVNTDVESIKKMRSKPPADWKRAKIPYEHGIRFLNLILLLRRIDKIIEYITVGVHPSGRVMTSTKIGGTTSGRTSNSQTSDRTYEWIIDKKGNTILKTKQLGFSFQTVTKHGFIIEGDEDEDIDEGIIGKDVREMLIADPHMLLVEIDRSQAEARVVDLLAEDYESLDEYGRIDKHCKVASYIYTNYTYSEILRLAKKEKTDEGENMRYIGKKGKHATNYDMGDYRLSCMANIPLRFAKEILVKLGKAYPNVKEVFHRQVEEQVRTTRTMKNPYGRVRNFYKRLDGHGIKVALSWYPQSCITDGTKHAMLKIRNSVDRTKAWMIAENHDSITSLVHYSYLRKYVYLAKAALEEPIDFRNGTFYRDYMLKIPTDVSIGKNWGNMHELKLRKLRVKFEED